MTDTITFADPPATSPLKRRQSNALWRRAGRHLVCDPVCLVCASLLIVIILIAVFAPLIAPYDPYKTSIAHRLVPIGDARYWLGTDELGRDLLTRLMYGGRASLFMGFIPVILATAIGGMLGIIAGYAGGAVNMTIMRVMDVFYAFPSVLLAVAISGALGAGLVNSLISLTLVFIPPLARVAESVTTQIRSQTYVEAARATGAANWRIVLGQVLSNAIGPILVYASSLVSVSIVIASGLSFLGLGFEPPQAEWGLMLNTLRQSIYVAPGNAVLPGTMIFMTSMCCSLVSDGLRAALDVRA